MILAVLCFIRGILHKEPLLTYLLHPAGSSVFSSGFPAHTLGGNYMMKKSYDDLTFADDFMFCKVLQAHPGLCRELLELAIGRPVGELVEINKQHPIEITPDGRGVRFDVYAKDTSSIVYDIEMQTVRRDSIMKRTRYAQGLLDLDQIERGSRFMDLKQSYVIFICTFNLFPEAGLHKYTFANICIENRQLFLGDEAEKIFLCADGSAQDLTPALKEFFDYLTTHKPNGSFTGKLENAVKQVKTNQLWRKDYMTLQEIIDDEKEVERKRAEAERERAEVERKRAENAEKRALAAEELIRAYREKYGDLSLPDQN
ncbi:MAG: Rpn family recombination-promoting nuclease/putative transposase [Eubacterium sp.]|nr:Rpn family recombination-promoting nuclease/putative transposase [Eubacterium sp.]